MFVQPDGLDSTTANWYLLHLEPNNGYGVGKLWVAILSSSDFDALRTEDGRDFEGTDAIKTVRCKVRQ